MAAAGRRLSRPLLASVAGMALGGSAGYVFAYRSPDAARGVVQALPLTRRDGIQRASERLGRHGVRAFLLQPYSGIPMKMWAVAGGERRIPPWQAVPIFVTARAARMTLVAAGARLLAKQFSRPLRDRFLVLMAVYVTVFFGIWVRMLRGRPEA